MRNLLDEDQVFIKGSWVGEELDNVAMEVPEYLEFILMNHDLNADERELIIAALDKYQEDREYDEEEEENEDEMD